MMLSVEIFPAVYKLITQTITGPSLDNPLSILDLIHPCMPDYM